MITYVCEYLSLIICGANMKILFYRYKSICETDIYNCFLRSGHSVIEMWHDDDESKAISALSRLLQDNPCDLIFSINFFPNVSNLCNIYHLRYVCWSVDSPVMELYHHAVSNKWNRLFLFDRAQYEDICQFNPENIFHFPLAVDVNSRRNCIDNATPEQINRFTSGLSFIGSLYTEKNPFDKLTDCSSYLRGYLDGIIEAQINTYGYYFVKDCLNPDIVKMFKDSLPSFFEFPYESYLNNTITLSELYIGNKITAVERTRIAHMLSERFDFDIYTLSDTTDFPHIHNRGPADSVNEMPIIFNKSQINLNPTCKAIRTGIPLRVFDTFASEGFMISNYQQELCELFVPGEDFIYYSNIGELPELIEYYLNHKTECTEIAHNAYKKTKELYNIDLRLNMLLLKAMQV